MGSELPMTSTSRPLKRHALLLQGLERIAMRCTVPVSERMVNQVETALDGGITVGDVSPAIDPTTSVCHGEDLHGKLALTLLTPQIADARVLLLTADREAAAVTAAPDPSTCIRVRLDNAGRLPFRTRAFDHVIIDGDMTVPARPFGRKVVEEILRVAQRDATWLVVTRHRRVPRRIRALRDYRLHLNGSAWSDTLSSVGLQPFARTYVRFDGSRLVEMRAASPVHGDSKSRSWGDAEGVLFCRSTPHPSTLQQVLDHVGAHLGARPQLDTILVRKIGKTASLALVGTERVLIRIPLSPIARARAVRNFSTLSDLRSSTAITGSSVVVPRPLLSGHVGPAQYFVEQQVAAEPAPERLPGTWNDQVLEFITGFHAKTRQWRVVDAPCFAAHFERPLERIAPLIDAAWMPAIERVRSLIAPITGERLPFVWTHGDYTLANCLYHRNGDLAAVVDWELSSREGLPLLDILQCMPVPNESNSDARWQRFDAVRMLFNDPTLQHSPRLRALRRRHWDPFDGSANAARHVLGRPRGQSYRGTSRRSALDDETRLPAAPSIQKHL